MWIVKLALGRPYSFIVMALLLLILGPLTILKMPKDIFPNIGIPVVSVIWTYSGLPPEEMSGRITGSFERVSLVTVNNIDHIESQSVAGISVIKYFFHQGTNIDLPMSQLTAVSQAWLKQLPPGITPPLIVAYNASSVPIIQLARYPANPSPSRGCSISPITSCGPSSQASLALRFRSRMAASNARSRSISINAFFRSAVCRPTTSSPR
jgi:multidrug efflux pump subunit AcrB